jgi:hypothetical protein
MDTDFDDVAETLELLRSRGYVLGTITNGNADVEQTVRKSREKSAIAPFQCMDTSKTAVMHADVEQTMRETRPEFALVPCIWIRISS